MNKYIALAAMCSTLLSFSTATNARYYDNYGYDRYDRYDNDDRYGYDQRYDRWDRMTARKAYRARNASRYRTQRDSDDESENVSDVSMPSKISGGNVIKVDLGKLAWGAYDDQGNLVKSGRASGGKSYCPDINRGCRTITGTYTIYSKKGPDCKSSRFPVGRGGAPMPYCMHFKGGYAMHGGQVPDHNASHGCIRLHYQDAQWLNQNFVRVGSTRVSIKY